MKGFSTNIEEATLENGNFRKVLYTSKHSQLVLMSLKPREEIGMEVHEENDQFFRFEKGQGKCIIDGNEYEVGDGFAIVVPAGAQHNVINTSKTEDLKPIRSIRRHITRMESCAPRRKKPKPMKRNSKE